MLRIEFPRVPISEESPAEVATFGESRTNQPFAADRIIGVNPLWQCLIAATYGHWQSTEIAYDPTARKFSTPQILGVCASCHSRRAELTGDFVPGDTYADH